MKVETMLFIWLLVIIVFVVPSMMPRMNEVGKIWKRKNKWCSQSGSDNISGFCTEVDCLYICYLNRYWAPWSFLPANIYSLFLRGPQFPLGNILSSVCVLFLGWWIPVSTSHTKGEESTSFFCLCHPPIWNNVTWSHSTWWSLPGLGLSDKRPKIEELAGAHLFWWFVFQTVSATNPCWSSCCLAHWSPLLCLSLVSQPPARSLSC